MNRRAIMEKYIKARIHEVDEKHLDPEQRAQLVNTFILTALDHPNGYPDPQTNPLYWDIACFCLEFLNRFAHNVGAEPLLVAQKVVSDFMYTVHYDVDMKSESLGPGRDEEERVWVERIKNVNLAEESEEKNGD